MPHRLFGTDGIRGVANHYPLDPNTVLKIGMAVASYFKERTQRPQIAIGRDTRLSGNTLECALVAGITAHGVGVVHLGVLPTGAVAHITRTLPAIAGIMISASHNSFEDNGIKIFQASGYKCDDALEQILEELIHHGELGQGLPTGAGMGKITYLTDGLSKYEQFIQRAWPGHLSLEGLRIALDTANGAAYGTAPAILRKLGADLYLFHHEPNGININLNCGSTHPQFIQRETKMCGAQVGFALDGDADRLICCDEEGEIVDGDEIMAILALDMIEKDQLAKKTLVATTQSNLGLDECLTNAGGRVLRTDVGDRHVIASLLEHNLNFGGEQSGHIIFRDVLPSSDGMLTVLQLLKVMRSSGKPLSVLRSCLKKYPQVQLNLPVSQKRPLSEMPRLQQALDEARQQLGSNGRIQFRYSGTESLARLLLEGPDQSKLSALGRSLAETIQTELG